MKLLTKAIIKKIPALYATENQKAEEKKIVVKFFTPDAQWTWYVLEGSEQEDGDWRFFGYVKGHEAELGYFMLSELKKVRGQLGLSIERDMYFGDYTLADVMAGRA